MDRFGAYFHRREGGPPGMVSAYDGERPRNANTPAMIRDFCDTLLRARHTNSEVLFTYNIDKEQQNAANAYLSWVLVIHTEPKHPYRSIISTSRELYNKIHHRDLTWLGLGIPH